MKHLIPILVAIVLLGCKKEPEDGRVVEDDSKCYCNDPYAMNYGEYSTLKGPCITHPINQCTGACSYEGDVFFYIDSLPGYTPPYLFIYSEGCSPSTTYTVYVPISNPVVPITNPPTIPTCNDSGVTVQRFQSLSVTPEYSGIEPVAYYFEKSLRLYDSSNPTKSLFVNAKIYTWKKNSATFPPCTAIKIE